MFKKVFKCFTLSAMVATMFIGSACQKDDSGNFDNITMENYNNSDSIVAHPLSKTGAIIRKFGSVVILNNEEDGFPAYRKYKTLKIRDVKWKVMQEWFYEDVRTNLFPCYHTRPSDPIGEEHGLYYEWEENFEHMDRDVFDYIIFKDENMEEEVKGFRIPTEPIMDQLIELLGGGYLIPDFLSLPYDGGHFTDCDDTDKEAYAGIWCDYHKAGIVPGCGAYLYWNKNTNNNNMHYFFPNTANGFGVNLRLVRTITKEQW
jgi:hypothetical protein